VTGALVVEPATIAGTPGLAVAGELDAATAPALETALREALIDTAGTFVLDLDGLAFMDSTGVNVLLRARSLLGRQDRRLALVCRPGPVRRVLELVGIADLFLLLASRSEAERALIPPRSLEIVEPPRRRWPGSGPCPGRPSPGRPGRPRRAG
jgi:anti-anti-sigma factor